jgi:hypothetical protein
MVNGPRFLVDTPSKTVPLTCPASYLVFGILYHWDPKYVEQGHNTLHRIHVRALILDLLEPKPCPLWDDRRQIAGKTMARSLRRTEREGNIRRLI